MKNLFDILQSNYEVSVLTHKKLKVSGKGSYETFLLLCKQTLT